MTENTKIEWADHTFNPWWGCTKVDPGCDHCYAETLAARFGVKWGVGALRRPASDAMWSAPLKWNRLAEAEGVRKRVFCASMADVFDARAEQSWRDRLWLLIESTPWLDWLILTKRPQLISGMVPERWAGGWPGNIWLGVSASDERGKWRIQRLLETEGPAVRFVSYEPALGPLDLTSMDASGHDPGFSALSCEMDDEGPLQTVIDWVIVGGESGPGARPFDIGWARDMVGQCQAAGVAVFVKQLGRRPMGAVRGSWINELQRHGPDIPVPISLRDRKGGDMSEWPEDLRVREFPR